MVSSIKKHVADWATMRLAMFDHYAYGIKRTAGKEESPGVLDLLEDLVVIANGPLVKSLTAWKE